MRKLVRNLVGERGDTLIEVTFALTILGSVLIGSMAIALTAFRTGQTARERTSLVQDAQQQMEALRNYRDNNSWTTFRTTITNVSHTAPCDFDGSKWCFHMDASGVPVADGIVGSVPTSNLEITVTDSSHADCGYDFTLHYSFLPLGGSLQMHNQIETRLVNMSYAGGGTGCPS